MTGQPRSNILEGNTLVLARLAWIGFALFLLVVQVASQIASWREIALPNLTPVQLQGLQAMGLTVEFYAAWRFFWQIPLPLFWGTLGLLIFLRRSNDRAALVVSAAMLGLSMAGSIPLWKSFSAAHPGWIWLVAPTALISNICINSFFFIFPTGRYVPRWSPGLVIVLSFFNILQSYHFALPPALVQPRVSLEIFFPAFLLISLASVIVGPYYRYRWVSTRLEQEQIKLVVFTIAIAFSLFAVAALTVLFVPNGNPDVNISFVTVFVQPLGWVLSLQLIPVAIAVSILRYRLFDIDLIIRRTFIYSLVTASLAVVYFGGVVVLQGLFRALTGAGDDLAIILSTLAIAALFNPLRRRIQDAIDHRFYRRKYDAQKVLAQFAVTARDETDLDKLTQGLINVVDDTMRPEKVSVWLQEATRPLEGRRRE